MDSLDDHAIEHEHLDPYGNQLDSELLFYKEVFDFEVDEFVNPRDNEFMTKVQPGMKHIIKLYK